jgi:hypothetical protein
MFREAAEDRYKTIDLKNLNEGSPIILIRAAIPRLRARVQPLK